MEALSAIAPQNFRDGYIHNWYTLIWGFSDHLVTRVLTEFDVGERARVLDPFCGSGTTLVECAKQGVTACGIDANPASRFAARVKTNWSLDPQTLVAALDRCVRAYSRGKKRGSVYTDDPTFAYLSSSGMLKRGWISPKPLHKALAIKASIRSLAQRRQYKDALMLALISEVVDGASNVKFGPELYCGPPKEDADVVGGFSARVEDMARDLTVVRGIKPSIRVISGDARRGADLRAAARSADFDAVICSPPYPAEHDYTRNSRLELAFLEAVTSLETLRAHKRRMLRSHTKNIYVGDSDGDWVRRIASISTLASQIRDRVRDTEHGFARYYPTVIEEYFGGMRRHFEAVHPVIRKGGRCAYIVGDQASYAGVPIPTAEILGQLAELSGFRRVGIDHWRSRRASTTKRVIGEYILSFTRP
jgi:hypothetical protein